MPSANKQPLLSIDEYLELEKHARIKHEFVDGRIFAMTGSTWRHNTIANNLHSLFRAHLKGSSCRAANFDLKVHVASAKCFYYPDVVIACGKQDDTAVLVSEPVLIVEVSSPSTLNVDRREKVAAYRQIPSLREYLIVSHSKQCVELHQRNELGGWDAFQFRGGSAEIELISMPVGPLKLRLSQIYEDTDLQSQAEPRVREEEFGYLANDDWDDANE